MKFRRRTVIGFSLLETVVGMLVIVASVVGSFEALRLSDLKARHSHVDNRVTELLRENSDYVMYVAYDLLPTEGAVVSQGSLYQLYDTASKTWKNFYSYTVTAHVQMLNQGAPSEIRNITLNMTYQVDSDLPTAQLKSQAIVSDVITRRKS